MAPATAAKTPVKQQAEPSSPSIPRSYDECVAVNADEYVTPLECSYLVLESASQPYIDCLAVQDRYRELAGLQCSFLPVRTSLILECQKPDGVRLFPAILPFPCELVYYNPKWVFPRNYRECLERGGELDETYRKVKTCTVVIRLAPFYGNSNKAVVNADFGKELLIQCMKLGGRDEMVATKYPICSMTYKQTKDDVRGKGRKPLRSDPTWPISH
jgi:hypothetical protein